MRSPKELIIEKRGEDSNTHHIFENPNAELKKQIQDYLTNYKSKEIKMGWPSKTYTVGELEGDEYRCTEGKNVTYFNKKEVEENLEEQKLYDMNLQFNVFHHFADIFGTISHANVVKGRAKIETLIPNYEKLNGFSMDGSYHPKSLAFFGDYYEREFSYSSYYDRYELKITKGPSVAGINMFFNKEGNIVNRDYNFKLQDFEPGIYDASSQIEELLNELAAHGDMEYVDKTKRLFGKDIAICLYCPDDDDDDDNEIRFSAVIYKRRKHSEDISYRNDNNHKKVIKKPTKTEKLTSEQVKIKILQFIPEDFLKKFIKIKE